MGRLIISGASSRSGKTTITCGLLASLRHRGLKVSAYKTGPDYIDTEYLRMAGKCQAYNLDTWLMSEEATLKLFTETSRGKDTTIIEGAMGLYDGGINSTASIARLVGAPVVLVVNAGSMGESAAAVALGFREYCRDINIAGVILNFTGSEYHVKIIAEALEDKGIKFLGALRRDDGLKIPERHLGLLQAGENRSFDVERLAAKFEECINVEELLRISGASGELRPCSDDLLLSRKYNARVAVARDEAFTFYYPESLDTLRLMGAEVEYFSPLNDASLPQADGYIFGGGYPEVFASELAGNATMLQSVRACTRPILAECGGMMYLCRGIEDVHGNAHNMAGVLPFRSFMTGRAVMGYMTGRALRDNLICRKGETVRGHEFHYSRVEPEYLEDTCAFELTRRNTGTSHYGGYAGGNILASYLHVNFWGNTEIAENFMNILTSSRL